MGKIVVTEFVSIDGVMEDPGGSENYAHGGWAFQFERGEAGDKFKLDELMTAEAMLLGRITYAGFAAAWPNMQDEQGFADRMNGMPKFVVSKTITDPTWHNTTVLSGDPITEIRALKERTSGDLLVGGSAQLVHLLAAHDLVDTYRLMIFPVVLGSGKKLFPDAALSAPTRLRVESAAPAADVQLLVLQRA
jgi:dihydrofolate reductase